MNTISDTDQPNSSEPWRAHIAVSPLHLHSQITTLPQASAHGYYS